jgi:hypothetical protein
MTSSVVKANARSSLEWSVSFFFILAVVFETRKISDILKVSIKKEKILENAK